MRIPQEIVDKVQKYLEYRAKADKLNEEIQNWFCDNTDVWEVCIEDFCLTDAPKGDILDGGEFLDAQHCGEFAEETYGTHYYPVEGDDMKYIGVSFWS